VERGVDNVHVVDAKCVQTALGQLSQPSVQQPAHCLATLGAEYALTGRHTTCQSRPQPLLRVVNLGC
jgi:hypothetical protein